MESEKSKKVRLYTMKVCPYCIRAKELLKRRGIEFEEILVSEDDDAAWDRLYQMSGMQTVPQIWAGEKLIGGYTDLAALDAQDQLASIKDAIK